MAGLASCVGFYAERYLRRHDLPLGGLEVHCRFEMSEDRPARVRSVNLEVIMPADLTPDQRKALRRVAEHCTVHNSLREAPAVQIDLAARRAAA